MPITFKYSSLIQTNLLSSSSPYTHEYLSLLNSLFLYFYIGNLVYWSGTQFLKSDVTYLHPHSYHPCSSHNNFSPELLLWLPVLSLATSVSLYFIRSFKSFSKHNLFKWSRLLRILKNLLIFLKMKQNVTLWPVMANLAPIFPLISVFHLPWTFQVSMLHVFSYHKGFAHRWIFSTFCLGYLLNFQTLTQIILSLALD